MRVYYCEVSEFFDLPGTEHIMPERLVQMDKYVRAADKARCLVSGLLIKALINPGKDDYYYNAYGKPYVKHGAYFNISHSGDYVMIGVSECEIGVDTELVTTWHEDIAERCFTGEEQIYLFSEDDKDSAFYKLWTGKESVMKACGLGLNLPPESFCVLPVKDGEHTVLGRSWYLYWFDLNGHIICAACEKPQKKCSPVQIHRQELLQLLR